jgi:Fic family protein
MDPNQFTAGTPGRLVKNSEGQWAFVPNPLPPKLQFDEETLRILSIADQKLGELAGVGKMLPNPQMLIGPFLRHEAVLSSRIEGTLATEEELLLFEMNPSSEVKTPDVREVANYVKALQYGLQRIKTLPISLRLIRELHERLLQRVRGEDRRPGEFRAVQNDIGNRGQPIKDARFVPPPVSELLPALDQFEKFLHTPSGLPLLIELAITHYQFETIHPFVDGNGRIGRLLISLLLCERGPLPKPLIYLSAYFERHRDQYVDLLFGVSRNGGWDEWIKFFLRGVAQQCEDATVTCQKLLELWQQYRNRMQTARASALGLDLIDALFANPVVTITNAAKRLEVTYASAKLIVDRLVEGGILKEATGHQRNRIYIAPEILGIVISKTDRKPSETVQSGTAPYQKYPPTSE